MTQIRLRILGECVIEIGRVTVEPSATHLFALLLYLSIERGRLVARSTLANIMFPSAAPRAATHNLRQLIYRLRRHGAPIECTSAAVRISTDSVIGTPESTLGSPCVDSLNERVRSVLLPGYTPPTRQFSAWLEIYRDQFTHKLQMRLARDLQRARQGADWAAVDLLARALLDIDPLNEAATLGLAEAIARTGSKKRALELLDHYAKDVGVSHKELTASSRILIRRISEDVGPPPVTQSMVGRALELRLLTGAWSRARSGTCTLSVITGEKSIGKSRVLDELGALVRLDGSGRVLAFRPLPGDRDRPMSLFSDLCRQLIQLPGGAGCSPDSVRYLQRLVGTPHKGDQAVTSTVDAHISETATRRAILDLLDSVASERPLLLCIDDADRLDSSSLDLIAALPELAPTLPIFFVFACGPEALAQLHRATIVRLAPLAAQDAHHLAVGLCASLGQDPTSETLAWHVAAASGNPGHLELLIRHHTGHYDTPSVPPTLIALLDERLQSLSSSARHILQGCVVYGSECPPDVVSALTGLDGYELLSTLETLVLHGFVTDSASGIACRSSLLAERVAAGISATVRTLLNSRAASQLERLIDKDLPSQATAWRIADHWQAAGRYSRSLHWRRVCWQQLISIGQPVAAAESIRVCLSRSSSLHDRAQLLDQLAVALRYASDARGLLQVLEERTALSDSIGDSASSRIALAAEMAEARYHTYEDTTKLLPELRALLRAPLLDEERRLRIARVWVVTADSMLSESLAREALAAVPKVPHAAQSASVGLEIQVIYHATFGDRRTAIELADLLHAVAGKQELSPARVFSHLTACLALRIVDSRPTEVAFLADLYERSVGASMIGAAIRVAARLGSMLHEDGDIDGARVWCDRTTQLKDQYGILRLTSDYVTLRVDIALADGNVGLARRLITSGPSQFPMYSSPKWSNAHHVYQTRVEQYEGNFNLTPERLSALMEWHRVAGHLGRHDDHMEVLWRALTTAGRFQEATEILRNYLTRVRREERACIYALRSTTASDPAWSSGKGGVTLNKETKPSRTSRFDKQRGAESTRVRIQA